MALMQALTIFVIIKRVNEPATGCLPNRLSAKRQKVYQIMEEKSDFIMWIEAEKTCRDSGGDMILYVNACVREDSRTNRVARALLQRLGGEPEEVRLAELDLQPLSEERLSKRTELIEQGRFSDPMFRLARQFQQADEIVVAAPYWDLSFPAVLKLYLENIYVTGLVSEYTESGEPHGLCRAKKLWYVTTAGGPYVPDFSYEYIRTLATVYFGIPETELIQAEMLDVQGYDAQALVEEKIRVILKEEF